MTLRTTLSVTLAATVLLVACSGRGQSSNESRHDKNETPAKLAGGTADSSSSSPVATSGRVARGQPIGKIRVINAIAVNGAPGPAIDLYDISRPDANTKPLVTNLQYGQVSDYVTPHGWVPGDTTSNLYILPAGSRTPSGPLQGENIDHSGFNATDQITVALFGSELGFGSSVFSEAGSRVRPGMYMDPTPPAGQGLLLVREAVSKAPNVPEPVLYLSIDGACPNVGGGIGGKVPIAPGDHTLGLVTSPPGHGLTAVTCAEKAPVDSVRTHVDAGQAIDVIAYGVPPSALKLIAAPVPK